MKDMSLFGSVTGIHYPSIVDSPSPIGNRYAFAMNYPPAREALLLIQNGTITKSWLLEIWSDDEGYSFETKVLLTLFWGHIFPVNFNYMVQSEVYHWAIEEMKNSLYSFINDRDENPLDHLQVLYEKLEIGDLRIKGLGAAFFTKIFFFFFASHNTCFSESGFLPIIADVWLRKAVYAEMFEQGSTDLPHVFCPENNNVAVFRKRRGNTGQSYISFLRYFHNRALELKNNYPELTPYALESYLFNDKNAITMAYQAAVGVVTMGKRTFSKKKNKTKKQGGESVAIDNSQTSQREVRLRVVKDTFGIKYPHNWANPTRIIIVTPDGRELEAKLPTFLSDKRTFRASRTIGKYIQERKLNEGAELNAVMCLSEDRVLRIILSNN